MAWTVCRRDSAPTAGRVVLGRACHGRGARCPGKGEGMGAAKGRAAFGRAGLWNSARPPPLARPGAGSGHPHCSFRQRIAARSAGREPEFSAVVGCGRSPSSRRSSPGDPRRPSDQPNWSDLGNTCQMVSNMALGDREDERVNVAGDGEHIRWSHAFRPAAIGPRRCSRERAFGVWRPARARRAAFSPRPRPQSAEILRRRICRPVLPTSPRVVTLASNPGAAGVCRVPTAG